MRGSKRPCLKDLCAAPKDRKSWSMQNLFCTAPNERSDVLPRAGCGSALNLQALFTKAHKLLIALCCLADVR